MAQMKPPPAEQTSFDVLPASTEQSYDSDVRFSNLTSTVPLIIPPPAANCSKRTTHRFHGPVSPDYSLNAAEIKIRQSQHPAAGSSEKTNPSVEDDETDDEEPVLYPEANNNRPNPRRQSTHMQELLQWPLLLSKREAVRLLDVYQEVIGDLHPIVDTKRLVEQVEICYALAGMEQDPRHGEGSIIDENTLILCLALSIAFAAETVTQSRTGKTLYNSLQNIIKIRVASRVTSLKHVIITLLLVCPLYPCLAPEEGDANEDRARVFTIFSAQRPSLHGVCVEWQDGRQWNSAYTAEMSFNIVWKMRNSGPKSKPSYAVSLSSTVSGVLLRVSHKTFKTRTLIKLWTLR
jgi:hypothetical protein